MLKVPKFFELMEVTKVFLNLIIVAAASVSAAWCSEGVHGKLAVFILCISSSTLWSDLMFLFPIVGLLVSLLDHSNQLPTWI